MLTDQITNRGLTVESTNWNPSSGPIQEDCMIKHKGGKKHLSNTGFSNKQSGQFHWGNALVELLTTLMSSCMQTHSFWNGHSQKRLGSFLLNLERKWWPEMSKSMGWNNQKWWELPLKSNSPPLPSTSAHTVSECRLFQRQKKPAHVELFIIINDLQLQNGEVTFHRCCLWNCFSSTTSTQLWRPLELTSNNP